MRTLALAILAAAVLPAAASAATLTITPDRSTYAVGDTITLSVFGDSEGENGRLVAGRILFDGSLATYVSSSQAQLTSFGGVVPWVLIALGGGDGFADAFAQICCDTPRPVDGPLVATVVLQATAPGRLGYDWQSGVIGGPDDSYNLDFFGLTDAPGGSVTIVPDPATCALLATGLLGFALWCAPHGRSRSRSPAREDARIPRAEASL